ncbi:X-linked retinitis pigmentosa GTPase regulator-interacting protein 1 [Habropoda laboriosa]|uniref:X-linked retinitis pigmentosa GTPase regulator-interacting protein 1 n=1 Tax=Habropoda laboriosa TaxID=597456 RepID=A0A0L7R1W8_9HYME|nr:X-linked retinitis pigmentosa GTPase regulator-interacting protein 1 [Habropoda laboriosa]
MNKVTSGPRPQDKQLADPNKILSVLFNILQEYCSPCSTPNEVSTLYREPVLMKDVNNNIDVAAQVSSSILRTSCNARKFCSSPYNKLRPDKFRRKCFSGVKKYNRPAKPVETNECSCNSSMKCNANSDCEGRCCGVKNMETAKKNVSKNLKIDPFNNAVTFSEHLTRTLGTTIVPRQLQDDSSVYNSWERRKSVPMTKEDESLHEHIRQLDKYRNIVNSVAGIPLQEIVDHAKITDTMLCKNDHEASESQMKSSCSLDCANECMDTSSFVSDTFPMVIADGQGLVELHIISLQLSTCAGQILYREGEINKVSLFVSWDIWNQETACTPTLKCPKLNFNSSFVYRISDLCSFFSYVLQEFVIFEVNVLHEDSDNYLVARGRLSIKDILDYPQNKLHYIAPVNSVAPCSVGMNFGQLSMWVRLSCDVEKVEDFKRKRGIRSAPIEESIASEEAMIRSARVIAEPKRKHVQVVSKEVVSKQDGDTSGDLPISAIQSILDKSSLTVVKESEEEVEHMLSEQRQIGSNIIHHKDVFPSALEWGSPSDGTTRDPLRDSIIPKETVDLSRPEPEMKTSSVMEFNAVISNPLDKDMIIIEVVSLTIFPQTSLMQNKEYQLLYIEYCFLGFCGAEMETVSLQKPQPPNQQLAYNFKRRFLVDEEKHTLQNNILRAMLDKTANPNIKFIVVCEPLPDETDTKECVEVGFANFNIREYALMDSEKFVSLPVYDPDENEQIGLLKVER